MIDTQRQEKLKRFLMDAKMVDAVKEVLRETYMRPREKSDVQTLAAERIALNLLEEAWRELLKYSTVPDERPERAPNPGV